MPHLRFYYLLHTFYVSPLNRCRLNEGHRKGRATPHRGALSLHGCCCNEGQVMVLYRAPQPFCTRRAEVDPQPAVGVFLSRPSAGGGLHNVTCQNVLSLSCLQMQGCEKYPNVVVFDLYIPCFVSSASINDRLYRRTQPLHNFFTLFDLICNNEVRKNGQVFSI